MPRAIEGGSSGGGRQGTAPKKKQAFGGAINRRLARQGPQKHIGQIQRNTGRPSNFVAKKASFLAGQKKATSKAARHANFQNRLEFYKESGNTAGVKRLAARREKYQARQKHEGEVSIPRGERGSAIKRRLGKSNPIHGHPKATPRHKPTSPMPKWKK